MEAVHNVEGEVRENLAHQEMQLARVNASWELKERSWEGIGGIGIS